PYIDLNTEKSTVAKLCAALSKYKVKKGEVVKALKEGFKRLDGYHADVRARADYVIKKAREEGRQIIVLAGRPYHLDNEINHGINKLLTSLNLAVLSEDAVFDRAEKVKVNVLNQWTYHARLYRSAQYCCENKDINLVQLVSFGCGIDAITTDEVRSIMEKNGKLYTQIKIDEINNLGVVKIRLRSMLAAIEEGKRRGKA
ncbi:MAG: 2-hydroxyacyl-CoA dehydratase, partial [Clostridia bacterium]|nr:2-hydroxyacyl-CoA dehydratase [Clostridia bacterium]